MVYKRAGVRIEAGKEAISMEAFELLVAALVLCRHIIYTYSRKSACLCE